MENRKEHRSRLKKEHCRPGLFTKLIDPLPVHFEPSNRQEELFPPFSFRSAPRKGTGRKWKSHEDRLRPPERSAAHQHSARHLACSVL
ncbi:hypothetical protein CXT89_07550 [Akkermansia muciniphila]|nr:hypothetical protein CXT89_07550 [Akkermansia muciniphila]